MEGKGGDLGDVGGPEPRVEGLRLPEPCPADQSGREKLGKQRNRRRKKENSETEIQGGETWRGMGGLCASKEGGGMCPRDGRREEDRWG